MTIRTFVAAVVVVLLAPAANAAISKSSVSRPPTVSRQMQWFHWHHSERSVEGRAAQVGSVAVVGLESMRDLRSLRARYGFPVVRVIPELHAAVVGVVRSLVANASVDPRIRYLAPLGQKRRLTAMPNDPLLSSIDSRTGLPYEWQFARSHVDRALELSLGSPTIVVGTIDTGVADVPDLAGKVDARWTVAQDGTLTRDAAGNDEIGHGTAVASLIAANADDGFGMAGFGGATHLIAVRAQALTDTEVAVALMKLDTLGVRIVNMSFGEDLPMEPTLRDAIHRAAADGILLVAAAGNSAAEVAYPAADLQPPGGAPSYGLAVGATDVAGNLASFSNSGERLSLVAPGGYQGPCSGVLVAVPPLGDAFVNSCYPNWTGDGGALYAYLAGTSFAAPEVAGVAALIWARRPELKNYEVAGIIKQSARRDFVGWTPALGCGVLDAGAALELATSYSNAGGADGSCSTGDPPPVPAKPDVRPTVVLVGSARAEPDSFRLVFGGRHATASFPTPSGLQHEGAFTTSSSLCPSGTAKDVAFLGSDLAARVFTCSGTGATFTAHVGPLLAEHGGSGTWQIVSGTGSLANLRGIGTWQSLLSGGDASDPSTVTFESTWKGVAAMDATPPKIALSRATISKLKRPSGAYRIDLRLSMEDDGGAATSYTLSLADARNPVDRLAQRSGQSATGLVSLTIRVKPAKKTRFLRLKIDATDAVGNGTPLVKDIRIR